MKNKIILFFPTITDTDIEAQYEYPWMPLSVLALAKRLIDDGYSVRIIDERVEDESIWKEQLKTIRPDELVFAGVSCMTGRQIHYGLKFSAAIRQLFPQTKIVWGGYHPTIFSKEVASHPFVDYVFTGHAEKNIARFARMLSEEKEEELEGMLGLCFVKADGSFISKPRIKDIDLSVFLSMPLELLDISKYLHPDTQRMPFISSVGCVNRCSFCYQGSYYCSMSSHELVDRLLHYMDRYGVKGFRFFDPNFFVSRKRVIDFCSEVLERKLKIDWIAFGDLVVLRKYSKEDMKLVYEAGCSSISIGVESGSPKLLELLAKGHKPDDLLEFMKRTMDIPLHLTLYYMFGLPYEDIEDFNMTVTQIRKAVSIKKEVTPGSFFYAPIPAVKLQEVCKSYGYQEPNSLEDWGRIDLATHDDFREYPWTKGLYTEYYRRTFKEVFGENEKHT